MNNRKDVHGKYSLIMNAFRQTHACPNFSRKTHGFRLLAVRFPPLEQPLQKYWALLYSLCCQKKNKKLQQQKLKILLFSKYFSYSTLTLIPTSL